VAKQVLIYDNIQPLNDKHRNWSVSVDDLNFVRGLTSVPLLATEIVFAAAEYPVVFLATENPGEYIPVALMGLNEGENLLLKEDGKLATRYVPAFIRRYPFILAGTKESDMLTVCIDEGSKACFPDGSTGRRLFDDSGEQSDHLKGVIEFLKEYHERAELTKAFCKKLHELDVFEPMQAQITFKDREDANFTLRGVHAVRHEKLKAISDADVLDLFKRDGLEVIYAHIQSLENIKSLINLMSSRMPANDPA
jgi:hypothetical protein